MEVCFKLSSILRTKGGEYVLEALFCFVLAFLVTSGLIPLLHNVWKDDTTKTTAVSQVASIGEKNTPFHYDSEEDYQYTFSDYGVTITGCMNLARTELKIPSMICHMPVVGIDSGAFENCKSLQKVLLPEHVMHIASDVFASTENLTLYGRYDTYAHKYAQIHRIRFRSADSFDTDRYM